MVSVEDDPLVLQLIHKAEAIYSGKVTINEVLPDEALIVGLFRANYDVDPESITALVQYSEESCRIIFLKGTNLLIISPIITEGSSSRKFLNTVFSKILFQLDTGEVPSLDRIILCNNSLSDTAIEFFEDRFPDIEVSEFVFNDEIFDTKDFDPGVVASFTSAISLAWADAGFQKQSYPDISFLPSYVKDRQKIFKLQWHGYLILALIISVFPISNYFFLGNSTEIESLRENVSSRKAEIRVLENTVQEYNRINSELAGIQTRLVLLDELSEGTLTWTVNLDLINKGIDNIDSIWLTNFTDTGDSGIDLNGVALYRNRIPMIADMFSNAVLKDVERILIREQEAFSFTYTITQVVANPERYTPESAKGLKEVLGVTSNMSYALRNSLILLVTLLLIAGGAFSYIKFVQQAEIDQLASELESLNKDYVTKTDIRDQYPPLLERYNKAREIVQNYDKNYIHLTIRMMFTTI